MSSIIVRGMDKPESCGKCFFRDGIFCKAKNYKRISYVALDGKIEIWCPIIEVPTPHGRLIDADKIDYRNDAMHDGTGHLVVADNFMNGVLWINDCIDNAPTIIEAEGTE